ncbi:hypothetical protein C6497_11430 [Candidatus Poribacteria bacterium]|nr:MAG: hypothetical protein C6497_11430 [Candidatus Poribacteria bacterium]
MRKKMYWGIATLILLLGGFCVFLFIKDRAEIRQLKEELTESNKLLEEQNKEKTKQPSLARDGFKMVPHDDHWHEVPIEAPDTGQGEPAIQSDSVKPYTGKLTYHKELLETHPVEALRKQAEERGHWSAKWIPPFPPEDQEAAETARTEYFIIYYETIGDTDNPEYRKANRAGWEQTRRGFERTREIRALGRTKEAVDARGRRNDLNILSWPRFPEADVPQFPLYEKGWRTSSSNYFPRRIEDLKFPLHISDSK